MLVCRKWDCEQDDELLPFAAGAFLYAPMPFTVHWDKICDFEFGLCLEK